MLAATIVRVAYCTIHVSQIKCEMLQDSGLYAVRRSHLSCNTSNHTLKATQFVRDSAKDGYLPQIRWNSTYLAGLYAVRRSPLLAYG